jgi:SAM-dependent methyltransferase
MTPFLRGMVEATALCFELPGPIVEIGSYHVDGQEDLIELRSLFPNRSYVGIDMRPGPGVDLVENVEQMTLADETIGTVLALSTLEHVKRFWKGVAEIKRIMRPDGVVLISTPFYFHIHQHPSDYWRFTPEALDSLLDDHFPQRIVGYQGPAKRPSNTWALAFGREYPRISEKQLAEYRRSITKLAHTPMKWGRLFRYRLASLLAGRKLFAAHLEQDQFHIELRRGLAKVKQAA